MKILFVCTAGEQRSPTAAKMYEDMGHQTDYAGVHGVGKKALSLSQLEWADLIVIMEEYHRANIQKQFPQFSGENRIHVLNIPDEYFRDAPELVELIESKMETVL